MNFKKIKIQFAFTLIIIFSCCSLSSANYYRYIVPPDSVMAINKASKLKPYLKSDSDIIKIWGIIRLGQLGDENDIDRLVEIYENEPDQLGFMPPPRVKYYSLVAIGEIGGIKAEQAIMTTAENSKLGNDSNSCNISAGICDALGRIASSGAILTLQTIRDARSTHCDIIFSRKNLYKIALQKKEFATIQDSILYLLNIIDKINTDRKEQPMDDNYYNRRAAEIVFLDILTPKNITTFKNVVQNKTLAYKTKALSDKIIESINLGLKWHTGRYSGLDVNLGPVPNVLTNKDLDSLENLLNHDYYEKRSSIFNNVILGEKADTSKFIDLLLKALILESELPDTSVWAISYRLPLSPLHIEAYLMYLADNGANYISQINSFAKNTSGDAGKWALISLGFLRHVSIKKDLRTIILNNPNPYLRARAVGALSEYDELDDFEIFKQSLADTFFIHVQSDVFLEDGTSTDYDDYRVRNEAIEALRNLGYSVSWDTTGNFHIEPEKK